MTKQQLSLYSSVNSPSARMSGRRQGSSGYSRLLHLDLLSMPLLVVELGLQPDHLLGLPGPLVGLPALLLPLLLMVVQAVPIPLAVQLNVLVLRLWVQGSGVKPKSNPVPVPIPQTLTPSPSPILRP